MAFTVESISIYLRVHMPDANGLPNRTLSFVIDDPVNTDPFTLKACLDAYARSLAAHVNEGATNFTL